VGGASHWGHALEGDVESWPFLSRLLSGHEASSLALPRAPCHDVLPCHSPKTGPSGH
jgi:hypothetical protein